MAQKITLTGQIEEHQLGARLDQALAELFPDYSRSRLKKCIEDNNVLVNDQIVSQPKFKLFGNEKVQLTLELEADTRFIAQDIELNIVYEDEHILVINKPKNLVVHPGAGNGDGTILNALLHYHPEIEHVPRAGIVHRLDKDTTGLMVVAKTIPAQTHLVNALQKRRIVREYEAVAHGIITKGGTIDKPIGRHATKRTQMAVHPLGKPAVTHYRVMEHFRDYTRLRLRLETGRTHQIRVHMASIKKPLLGDQVYGGRLRIPRDISDELLQTLRDFQRQALHATMLQLHHPITKELMQWNAPIPEDFVELVHQLKQDYLLHRDNLDY